MRVTCPVHLTPSEFITLIISAESRGSSGSIVSDYGLDDQGSIPGRGRGFFF
jgi:hypothetical protein